MQEKEITKKYLVGLLMVVAAVAVVSLVVWYFKSGPDDSEQAATLDPDKIVVETVKHTDLPKTFPADVPLEAGSEIVKNENSTDPDGTTHATRVFVTKKTLAENYTIYTNYLKNNGWTIDNSVNDQNNKVIFATRGPQAVEVAMLQLSGVDSRTISISFTEK